MDLLKILHYIKIFKAIAKKSQVFLLSEFLELCFKSRIINNYLGGSLQIIPFLAWTSGLLSAGTWGLYSAGPHITAACGPVCFPKGTVGLWGEVG